ELLHRIAERLKAIADPTRLKILHSLEDGELSVTEILKRVGSTQTNISKHLAILRRGGLVATRREGLNIYYRVADETAFSICRTVCDALEHQVELERATLAEARARGGSYA
nr:metalloregulator ArsR/SmtB family transcription factor [Thermoanaerobaculia bacterium]